MFKFDGFDEHLNPSITKYGFEDLGDNHETHRWRAQWTLDNERGKIGIVLFAYPVIKLTPRGAWISTNACRQATRQPWEEGSPAMEWTFYNAKKRLVMNGSGSAWAKPTQSEAIKSLAIRLERWSANVAREADRIYDAILALNTLRPDLSKSADIAEARMKQIGRFEHLSILGPLK